MKVYMKPIRMIPLHDFDGGIKPLRFQMVDEQKQLITIKVDKIVTMDKEKLAGNVMYIYQCQSTIDSELKVYELKYEVSTCRWYLFKF